mmetsp:Transcript_23464/g.50611  ORF Transcript_23464/g.50611 Transcript_23464/m.50611 type:complete len:177 (-) Transcript_23464:6-536(-)
MVGGQADAPPGADLLTTIINFIAVKIVFETSNGTRIIAGKVCELPTGCSVLVASEVNGTNPAAATILELNTGSRGGSVECAKVAVEVARLVLPGELLVDVAGNGGGDVGAGYALNDYLYRGMAEATSFALPIDSCEWYDFPKSPALDWQLKQAQRGLTARSKDTCDQCTKQLLLGF